MNVPTQAQIEAAAIAISKLWKLWNYGPDDWKNPAFDMIATAALTAAAEVGEQHGPPISEAARLVEYAQSIINERNATIERCAQVVDERWPHLRMISDAIRALKDQP